MILNPIPIPEEMGVFLRKSGVNRGWCFKLNIRELTVQDSMTHGSMTASPSPHCSGRLKFQILLWFILVSIVPLLIIGIFLYRQAAKSLYEDQLEYIDAIAHRQASEIEAYLENMVDVARFMTRSLAADEIFSGDVSSSTGERMRRVVEELDFIDVLLFTPQQEVLSSIKSQLTPGKPLASQSDPTPVLQAALYRALTLQAPVLSPFVNSPYYDEPVLYIVTPVWRDSSTVGLLALVLSTGDIDQVVSNRIGLGLTGETVLGASDGNSIRFLNNTFHDPNAAINRKLPLDVSGQPTPLQLAINGQPGCGRAVDYRGVEVLAAWTRIPGVDWGLVVKMDSAEADIPVLQLRKRMLIGIGITLLAIVIAAWVAARLLSRPIQELTRTTLALADGDLSNEPHSRACNEIGILADAIRTLVANLKRLIGQIRRNASQIASSAAEINASAQREAQDARQSGTTAVEISATARQIAQTANQLTHSMADLNEISQKTALSAENGIQGLATIESTLNELSTSCDSATAEFKTIQETAKAIQQIIATMTTVADRTNLLSLNATIEARKAGEHGKGFAVVAWEIQKLADHTAVSTLDIEQSVAAMLKSVRTGVTSMDRFSQQVRDGGNRIRSVNAELARVIQEVQGLPSRFEQVFEGMRQQSTGAVQIEQAIHHLSERTQETAQSLENTLRLLRDMKDMATAMEAEISRFRF